MTKLVLLHENKSVHLHCNSDWTVSLLKLTYQLLSADRTLPRYTVQHPRFDWRSSDSWVSSLSKKARTSGSSSDVKNNPFFSESPARVKSNHRKSSEKRTLGEIQIENKYSATYGKKHIPHRPTIAVYDLWSTMLKKKLLYWIITSFIPSWRGTLTSYAVVDSREKVLSKSI